MTSSTRICNQALRLIRAGRITNLDDGSVAAGVLSDIYEDTVKEVLGWHTWSFAKTQATLQRLSDDPAFEFDYAYQLPSDCLIVTRVAEAIPENGGYNWARKGDQIHTSAPTCKIEYTAYVTDPLLFAPYFIGLLAHYLALKCVEPLAGGNANLAARLAAQVQELKKAAIRISSKESSIKPISTTAFMSTSNSWSIDETDPSNWGGQ